MDMNSLYYFSEFSKDLHFTKAANRLFISQQTLSNHILRLEEYFGMPLLIRKPTPKLTYAGEQVLAFSKSIIAQETRLRDMLFEYSQEQRGILRFGASTMRLNACLPHLLTDFTRHFPNVEIMVKDTISDKLEKYVLGGDLDLAIVLGSKDYPELISVSIISEQIYLCVSDQILQRYCGNRAEEIKARSRDGACVKDFLDVPFCLFNNRLGELVRRCFEEIAFEPKPYITTTFTQIGLDICFRHMAACFAAKTNFVNLSTPIPKDMNIFPLVNSHGPVRQGLSMIYRNDRIFPSYFDFFKDRIIRFFAQVEAMKVEELIKLRE